MLTDPGIILYQTRKEKSEVRILFKTGLQGLHVHGCVLPHQISLRLVLSYKVQHRCIAFSQVLEAHGLVGIAQFISTEHRPVSSMRNKSIMLHIIISSEERIICRQQIVTVIFKSRLVIIPVNEIGSTVEEIRTDRVQECSMSDPVLRTHPPLLVWPCVKRVET